MHNLSFFAIELDSVYTRGREKIKVPVDPTRIKVINSRNAVKRYPSELNRRFTNYPGQYYYLSYSAFGSWTIIKEAVPLNEQSR